MATYMSSPAIHACDDMAPISRQPGMLPLSFELAGTAGALRQSSVQYNIAPMSARAHLQGASGFFDFFRFNRVDCALAASESERHCFRKQL